MTQSVLLVGGTGMLGARIAHHVMQEPDVKLRLLVRKGRDAMADPRAEIIHGELGDPGSLDRATQGIDVIISAVQGGPDVIVDGQVALAEAGKKNGARRILPSDFGLDLFKATEGEHAGFNARAAADARIATLGLEHVHLLQGAFMNMFAPGSPLVDYEKGRVTFWGDGHRAIELTTVDDTARMTARVALDRSVGSGKLAFCGDKVSFHDVADLGEKLTGKRFERHSLGSEADLRAAREAESDPFKVMMLGYQLYMLNGQTSLEDLQSARYPDLKLETFSDFLQQQLRSGRR